MIRVNVEIMDHRRSNVIRMSLEEYRDFIKTQGDLLGVEKVEDSSFLKGLKELKELRELEKAQELKGFIGFDLGFIACRLSIKSEEENENLGGIRNDK